VTDHVKVYWQTTGLTPEKFNLEDSETGEVGETDQRASVREAALKRAHEIRQFEIELYWKRANYFWILQAAVFAAIGLTWRFGGENLPGIVPVALSALGALTAFAGYLSAKGSKFWQENWEHHIDMLEDEFEGRLHKTAYVGKDGIAWSVSGVNDRLAVCFAIFWISILVTTSIYANDGWKVGLFAYLSKDCAIQLATIAVWLGLAAGGFALWMRRTRFAGSKGVSFTEKVPTFEGSDWIDAVKLPEVKDLAELKKPFLIRREPKI
jgi:hypothetical protein